MAGGRPSKYKDDYARQAEVACVEGGFTLPKLAKLFAVDPSTVSLWLKNHPEFSEAVKKGRDKYNSFRAEDCLLKRLKGYRYKEKVKELVFDKTTGTNSLEVTKIIDKHQPADTTSLIFFLKNRDPERWRDKREHEVSGPGGKPIEMEWTVKVIGVDNKEITGEKG